MRIAGKKSTNLVKLGHTGLHSRKSIEIFGGSTLTIYNIFSHET